MPERLGRVLMPKVTERRQSEEVAKRLEVVPLRHVDLLLPGSALFLVGYGLLVIYSATRGTSGSFLLKQVISLVLGLLLGVALLTFDYRRLKVATPFIYGFIIFALLLVFLWGEVKGSGRWISLGPINFQPSEYAKLVMILVLANVLSESKDEPGSLRGFIVPVLWTLPVMLLIFLQPDLGTALVVASILLSLLFLAGARMRYWLGLVGAGMVAFLCGIFLGIFKEYQVKRLLVFFNQAGDTSAAGYQLAQSKIAIGSGQVLGKGLTHGTQTNLNFTPEHHTDFIFSVVGEELGLIGALILIAAFCFLFWRFFQTANNSRDLYGTYVAMGVLTMFAFQVVVNIGMAIGIMPITGIPLPFISYGGSNLIVALMSVALVMNVNMHRFSQL
jgi:rod shape determining protein RodA